jgi:hypothetical protein
MSKLLLRINKEHFLEIECAAVIIVNREAYDVRE